MPKLKAIIVDDEEFARSSLYFLLQQNCPNVIISGISKSVAEARALLETLPIDLIFLDIAMPIEDGFELLPAAQLANANIIFTTAYDQYAIKAIKANALDYLLKPIDIEELILAVEKAIETHKLQQSTSTNNNKLLGNLAQDISSRNEISRITLPHINGHRIIEIENILHIEADSNYSIFHLLNGEKITVSRVLKDYEELLPEDKFFRVHKSSIVNLSHIKEYQTKNGLVLTLSTGENITVSRRRASDFFERVKLFTTPQIEK